MHYFLVAAVIGFFGYLLVGQLEQHKVLDKPRYILGGITIDLTRVATLWIARGLTILLIAVIVICVMYLHDPLCRASRVRSALACHHWTDLWTSDRHLD